MPEGPTPHHSSDTGTYLPVRARTYRSTVDGPVVSLPYQSRDRLLGGESCTAYNDGPNRLKRLCPPSPQRPRPTPGDPSLRPAGDHPPWSSDTWPQESRGSLCRPIPRLVTGGTGPKGSVPTWISFQSTTLTGSRPEPRIPGTKILHSGEPDSTDCGTEPVHLTRCGTGDSTSCRPRRILTPGTQRGLPGSRVDTSTETPRAGCRGPECRKYHLRPTLPRGQSQATDSSHTSRPFGDRTRRPDLKKVVTDSRGLPSWGRCRERKIWTRFKRDRGFPFGVHVLPLASARSGTRSLPSNTGPVPTTGSRVASVTEADTAPEIPSGKEGTIRPGRIPLRTGTHRSRWHRVGTPVRTVYG